MTDDPRNLMRRVTGYHDIRMDGISDLVIRARGASVFDIGCNRGLVGFEFANNGARLVHGCDIYKEGIETAREIFKDLNSVQSRFEVVDLTKEGSIDVFGNYPYDIVLLLAIVHKLRRVMKEDDIRAFVRKCGNLAHKYIGWRSVANDKRQAKGEMEHMDEWLGAVGMKRVQTSFISDLGPAAIWAKS